MYSVAAAVDTSIPAVDSQLEAAFQVLQRKHYIGSGLLAVMIDCNLDAAVVAADQVMRGSMLLEVAADKTAAENSFGLVTPAEEDESFVVAVAATVAVAVAEGSVAASFQVVGAEVSVPLWTSAVVAVVAVDTVNLEAAVSIATSLEVVVVAENIVTPVAALVFPVALAVLEHP